MIEVTGCRVLVKPFSIQEHDKVFAAARRAGIALPDMAQRKEQINVDKGVVIQLGEGCHPDYVGKVSIGDTIGFAKFGGKYVQDLEKEELFLIINDEDVICVFKEDAHE